MKTLGAPLVSVVIATYNHAPFVQAAIRSVLAQEGVDFELLVADDGSTDGTADLVAGISDPRLQFEAHRINRGACVVTNELIAQARGEFVAILNSDDVWLSPDKLAYQVEVLRKDERLGATFGRVAFMDREGAPIDKASLHFGQVFDQENRTQAQWLRRFFFDGNCLCHPSVLIRRACYEELGMYDNRLRQLPDFDMWIRLVKAWPIHVSDRALTGFRILPGENASAQTPVNSIRTGNEHYFIAERFFDGIDPSMLQEIFEEKVTRPPVDAQNLDIEAALLLLHTEIPGLAAPYQFLGMLRMHALLADPAARMVLESDYGVDDRWFHQRTGAFSNDALRGEVVRLAAEVKELRASTSWRVTAPLRRLSSLLLKR